MRQRVQQEDGAEEGQQEEKEEGRRKEEEEQTDKIREPLTEVRKLFQKYQKCQNIKMRSVRFGSVRLLK